MITVAEAIEKVLNTSVQLSNETINISQAKGRKLMHAVFADHDFPPFNRAMMDGFAISFEKWMNGQRSFRCTQIQTAGALIAIENETECIEIMTGAVVPSNFDCIIPVENLIEQTETSVSFREVEHCRINQHIHFKGSDRIAGDLLIEQGQLIGPQHIAILASNGVREIMVQRFPNIAIIATGDELVSIDQVPLPYQIRMSNGHALAALLEQYANQVSIIQLTDDIDSIRKWIQEQGVGFDVLVFSGGVSKGKKDFLPMIWKDLGYETIFHGVAQKPGKPMWFGKKSNQLVFGLPGNPISSLFCAVRYVVPWLKKINGIESESPIATFESKLQNTSSLTQWIPVQKNANALWKKVIFNGSGDLNGLTNAQGFIEIHPGEEKSQFPIFLL